MTRTERDQLDAATTIIIGLIKDIRVEMQEGFTELREGQEQLSHRTTVIETKADEAARHAEKSLKLRMWAFGLAVSATVSVALWIAKDFVFASGAG